MSETGEIGTQTQINDVYNQSAAHFEATFNNDGTRISDIELALRLAGNPAVARVVEIGCGTGRDAVEIAKRVGWYEGFDPAAALIEIAKKHNPGVSFVVADALNYTYPPELDVVFAFASLLHVSRSDLKAVLSKIASALRSGGILFASLRERAEYTEEPQVDEFGKRMFYYYNTSLMSELAGKEFQVVQQNHDTDSRGIPWFRAALKRN